MATTNTAWNNKKNKPTNYRKEEKKQVIEHRFKRISFESKINGISSSVASVLSLYKKKYSTCVNVYVLSFPFARIDVHVFFILLASYWRNGPSPTHRGLMKKTCEE